MLAAPRGQVCRWWGRCADGRERGPGQEGCSGNPVWVPRQREGCRPGGDVAFAEAGTYVCRRESQIGVERGAWLSRECRV